MVIISESSDGEVIIEKGIKRSSDTASLDDVGKGIRLDGIAANIFFLSFFWLVFPLQLLATYRSF